MGASKGAGLSEPAGIEPNKNHPREQRSRAQCGKTIAPRTRPVVDVPTMVEKFVSACREFTDLLRNPAVVGHLMSLQFWLLVCALLVFVASGALVVLNRFGRQPSGKSRDNARQ